MAKPKNHTAADIHRKHSDFLWPAVANYYAEPLVLECGDGLWVHDVEGRSYLDFFGGILTVSIGHCDPRVTTPLKEQIDRLGHVSSLYQTIPTVELAETLARITPGKLKKSFFTATGSEADDTAVVLSQIHTGAQEVIALRHGYSGRGVLSQALTGHASWRAVPSQIAAVKHAHAPYCYRCPFGLTYPGCSVRCARDMEELIETTTTGRIAAFLAEPILGVGGFVTPPREYFEIAVEIVRRHGGLFICDEVQTGFGRTGTHMFGIGHWGVDPEIMTMAKGVANGLPIAVTITTDTIADSFQKLTISTFGGNPISCAAALATIDTIEKETLVDRAEQTGRRLREGLDRLKQRFPKPIGDVRGMGLMQAIELVADGRSDDRTPDANATLTLFEETRKRGLLIGKGGLRGNVIRIAPPLTVGESEVDEAIQILTESFESLER